MYFGQIPKPGNARFLTLLKPCSHCDHSSETYWAILSCGTVYYAVQGGSNLWVCGWNPSVTIQMKATEQYFPVVPFIMLYKVVLTFESVDEILKCDHSNESYWAVLSCDTVQHAV